MGDFGWCLVARFQKLGKIIHESGVVLQPEIVPFLEVGNAPLGVIYEA
jgi:hypothetical protein